MQAAFITGYGTAEVNGYGEVADPVDTPGHVVIDVRAAGVNPVEIAMREGEFKKAIPFRFPQVMGYDVSGVVRSVGAGVRAFAKGDEVYARLPNRAQGAYAQRALVPADLLARKPSTITHVEAASLPTVGLTTWQAFRERRPVRPGDVVFVQPGAGGIGTFAIQLAKHLGARVVASSGPKNIEFIREIGADVAIDYTKDRFERVGPFDIVYDGVGGELFERSIAAVRRGGTYIGLVRVADARAYREIGVPAPLAWLAARSTATKQREARLRGVEFHGVLTRPNGTQLEEIGRLVDSGIITPVVSRTFPLTDLREAYRMLGEGHVRGKLVIDLEL